MTSARFSKVKGHVCFWMCALSYIKLSRVTRPQGQKWWSGYVRSVGEMIRLYRQTTDYGKYVEAVRLTLNGTDSLTPDIRNVYYMDYHRQKEKAENE